MIMFSFLCQARAECGAAKTTAAAKTAETAALLAVPQGRLCWPPLMLAAVAAHAVTCAAGLQCSDPSLAAAAAALSCLRLDNEVPLCVSIWRCSRPELGVVKQLRNPWNNGASKGKRYLE